ncbi:hypothetical protein B0H14DRAFT_2960635 [Mycena olivaceomarginata]|nr:hypothetical protein B0H14DRAFT_2960635 [Mycena olivaceomarginata]
MATTRPDTKDGPDVRPHQGHSNKLADAAVANAYLGKEGSKAEPTFSSSTSGSSPQFPREGSGANLLPESNANSWGEFGRDVGIILGGFAALHYVHGAVNARAARAIDAATEERNTLVTKKHLDGGRVFQGKPRDFSTSAEQAIKLGSKYSPNELHPVLHTTNLGEELPFHPCTSRLEMAQALGEYAEIPTDTANGLRNKPMCSCRECNRKMA